MSLLMLGPWFDATLLLMAVLGALGQWRESKRTAPGPP